MILPHPVGNQVFNGDYGKLLSLSRIDELNLIAISMAIQEH